MNVLLLHPRMGPGFWSLSASCRIGGNRAPSAPLGLITVAALLPDAWTFRLVDCNVTTLAADHWEWADVVLVSGMTHQSTHLLTLIWEARQRGLFVVAGGPHTSLFPDEVRAAGANLLVRGEVENMPGELIEAIQVKRNAVLQADVFPDLTRSPVPRFDLLDLRKYGNISVQTSRGCPFECEFCEIVELYGRVQRFKTPAQVLREFEALHDAGHRGSVFLADDNFIGHRTRALDLLESIRRWQTQHGEPFGFITQASLNLGRDVPLIDAMTAANIGEVFVGVESPDIDALATAGKTHNTKDSIPAALDTLCRNGLSVIGSFIIGMDGDHAHLDDRICNLIEATAIPVSMVGLLVAIPGTRLSRRLQAEGRLSPTHGSTLAAPFPIPNFITSRPLREILREFRQTWIRLYDAPTFIRRTHRFYLRMRPTRAAAARTAGKHLASAGQYRPPLTEQLLRLRALLILLWIFGIRRSCRGAFWHAIIDLRRRNPSRLIPFLIACAVGESLIRTASQLKDTSLNAGDHTATAATPGSLGSTAS